MPISANILKQYPNTVFIETGTNRGEGVQAALDAHCFDCIMSTEISLYCQGWCAHRFWDLRTKVWLFGLDSRDFLWQQLPKITTRCTFWLDAHFCDSEGGSPEDVPLLEELYTIRSHAVKNHTILIDDVRLMGTPKLETSLKRVTDALLKINKDYTITRIDSPEFENDILVAELKPLCMT